MTTWIELADMAEEAQTSTSGTTVPCRSSKDFADTATWISDSDAEQHIAAEACISCPLFVQCRDFGLEHSDEWGVYGGLTNKERADMAHAREKGLRNARIA